MRCIILAGGTGSRLGLLTAAVNKHLLPVGREPMICHPLRLAAKCNCEEVLIVTTPEAFPEFQTFIAALGRRPFTQFETIALRSQSKPAGIADAISYGRAFAADDPILVLLGDNRFGVSSDIRAPLAGYNGQGAMAWVSRVDDPRPFGVVELAGDQPVTIEEKPENPRSHDALTGAFVFDKHVWQIIRTLEPSARGELEVSDLLRAYLVRGQLKVARVNGAWYDAGSSVEAYVDAFTREAGI